MLTCVGHRTRGGVGCPLWTGRERRRRRRGRDRHLPRRPLLPVRICHARPGPRAQQPLLSPSTCMEQRPLTPDSSGGEVPGATGIPFRRMDIETLTKEELQSIETEE